MSNLKKYNFIFLIVLFTFFFGTTVLAYNDLSQNNWAYTAVEAMRLKDILHGYPDGNFYPEKNVTREEFAKIVVNTLELTQKEVDIKYQDIEDNRWSKEFIDIGGKYFTAYKMGDKYFFKPEEDSLREDVIVTTVLALNLENTEYDLDILNQFSDKDQITPSLEKYIAIAVQNDLIHGYADGRLNPQGRLTRAEVSQFMYNILVRLENGELIKIPVIEEMEEYEKVPDGQIKKFAKKLKAGKKFSVTVNGNKIKGNMWKDGELFELYPVYENVEFIDQYLINEKIDSGMTMYGAEHAALVYGFEIEKLADDMVRFVYKDDNKKYYADSKVENTHVDADTVFNFTCFIFNKDKNVRVQIEDEILELKDIITAYDESYFGSKGSNYPHMSTIKFDTEIELIDVVVEVYNSKDELVSCRKNQADGKGIKISTALKPGEEYKVLIMNAKDEFENKYTDLEYSFKTNGAQLSSILLGKFDDLKVTFERDEKGMLTFTNVGWKGQLDDGKCLKIVAYTDEIEGDWDLHVELPSYFGRSKLLNELGAAYKDRDAITFEVRMVSFDNRKIVEDIIFAKRIYIEEKAEGVIEVEYVSVSPSIKSVQLNTDYMEFNGYVYPSTATDKTIVWSSSDDKIATVDQNGKVTIRGIGEVKIIVTSSNGKKASALLEVYALRFDELTLEVGENAKDSFVHGADKFKEFKTLNSKVATVDKKGVIKAVGAGRTEIIGVDVNGKEIKCVVTVKAKDIAVQQIKIEHSNLHISLASSYTLKANITPSNATDKKITWLSSDPTIAAIDENGKITPNAVGDVIITAVSSNGLKSTMPLEIYALRYKSKELEIGQVERIVHGAGKLKDFKSSNETVATVDQAGNVKALKAGTAIITLKDNNGKVLSCPITVKEPEIAVTGVSIGYSNLTMSLGKTRKFEAKITPSNATNKTIIWTSSNPKVAAVNEEGNVVPNGVGKTTITATSENGKKSSCILTIYTLKYESTIFEVGESECIAHGVEKLRDFKSSNTKVATVDQKGVVTTLSGGETTITCKDNNGTEIKCVITVKDENAPVEPIVFKMTPDKTEFEVTETINLSVKSGALQGSEAIIWYFEIDGTQIATNSGYSMKVSKIIDIGSKRYTGEIYNKEITLKAFPRNVRDNSDREVTEFKFIILKPVE